MKFRILIILLTVSCVTLVQSAQPETDYKALMNDAKSLALSGNHEKAVKVYTRILDDNHRNVDALVGRGNARLRIDGEIDGAKDDFGKVTVLSPDYLDAHIGLATALKRSGDDEGSNKALNRALEICGNDAKKKQYLADTAWAFAHWEFARELDPKYKSLLSEREIQQAEYISILDHARELRLDGFVDEAEEIYLDLLNKNPEDVDALVGLGYCKLRSSDRVTEALNDFRTAIDLSPLYVDAYIGGAICYRRLHKQEELERLLDDCRIACDGDGKKLRYLALTAWREGCFPLARNIDNEYPPEKDRILLKDPRTVRLTYGHSWLEQGDDWDEVRLSGSWRIRPDISLSSTYDHWWRYGGEQDFNIEVGAAYRHNDRWSVDYDYKFSDTAGYLADQKHSADLRCRLYKRLHVSVGPRFAIYDDVWSRKIKVGADLIWKDLYASVSYSFGQDTKREDVESWSVGLGYYQELRYSIVAGYSQGDETIDFERNDDIIFRTDEVESVYLRGTYYFTDTCGMSLGGMYEYRNSDLFRRELTVALFKSF